MTVIDSVLLTAVFFGALLSIAFFGLYRYAKQLCKSLEKELNETKEEVKKLRALNKQTIQDQKENAENIQNIINNHGDALADYANSVMHKLSDSAAGKQ